MPNIFIKDEIFEELMATVVQYMDAADSIPNSTFCLATDEQRTNYIERIVISDMIRYKKIDEFKFRCLTEDTKKKYVYGLSRWVHKGVKLGDEVFNECNNELKSYYISSIIPITDAELTLNQFNSATPLQKIEYIMYRGFQNINKEIKEWYPTWKAAMMRDCKIDKIFLD